MTTKGESLLKYAQSIAKRREEGKLEISADIKQLQADLDGGHCPLCHKDVEEYTSKKGNTYVANIDHSPHTVRTKTDVICVYNWDQFQEHAPAREGQATSYTGKSAGGPASSGFTPSNLPELDASLELFDKIVSSAYLKLYQIASRSVTATTDRDKHISTMALLHDFFSFRLANALEKR